MCSNMHINIVDALEFGRNLCGDVTTEKMVTPHQAEAMDAFKQVIISGGELVEELAERAIAIARKKQAEAEFHNHTKVIHSSKSA